MSATAMTGEQTKRTSDATPRPIRRALVSVSDKNGLVPFVKALAARGVEIISTGGTAKTLAAAGVTVTPIDAVTGFPEIMDGRVKTLHPKVHGGLLGVRDNPEHQSQAKEHGIEPIDLVCVNLYPFEETIAKPGVSQHDAIENIDIGGPSMLRSAAKNFAFVTVVTESTQYDTVIAEMDANGGATTLATRAAFAAKVFETTARYDGAIAEYLAANVVGGEATSGGANALPETIQLSLRKVSTLRYGENPHQAAALYRNTGTALGNENGQSVATAKQLHGKELSYNNINDAAAALDLVVGLAKLGGFGACVVKHTNPCGAAIDRAGDAERAVDAAIAGDPIAAYGGILAVNGVIDGKAADRIAGKDRFFEVVIAPGYTDDGLATLKSRWVNVRLLSVGDLGAQKVGALEVRSFAGGVLVQERDTLFVEPGQIQHAAGPMPDAGQLQAAAFLEVVGRGLFSNAVVLGGQDPERPGTVRMFGGGAGQMDRVTSCKIAIEKAGLNAKGAVVYSDAFFPFADGPTLLAAAGVKCIAHPGGSKRDQDTFDLCNAQGITCLITGTRHFRH